MTIFYVSISFVSDQYFEYINWSEVSPFLNCTFLCVCPLCDINFPFKKPSKQSIKVTLWHLEDYRSSYGSLENYWKGAAPFNLLRVMRDIGTIPLERKRLPYRHIMSTWTFFLFLQTIFVDNICHWFWSDSSKLQMVAVWATNGIKW